MFYILHIGYFIDIGEITMLNKKFFIIYFVTLSVIYFIMSIPMGVIEWAQEPTFMDKITAFILFGLGENILIKLLVAFFVGGIVSLIAMEFINNNRK